MDEGEPGALGVSVQGLKAESGSSSVVRRGVCSVGEGERVEIV